MIFDKRLQYCRNCIADRIMKECCSGFACGSCNCSWKCSLCSSRCCCTFTCNHRRPHFLFLLADDTLSTIFSFLPYTSLHKLQLTCSYFYKYVPTTLLPMWQNRIMMTTLTDLDKLTIWESPAIKTLYLTNKSDFSSIYSSICSKRDFSRFPFVKVLHIVGEYYCYQNAEIWASCWSFVKCATNLEEIVLYHCPLWILDNCQGSLKIVKIFTYASIEECQACIHQINARNHVHCLYFFSDALNFSNLFAYTTTFDFNGVKEIGLKIHRLHLETLESCMQVFLTNLPKLKRVVLWRYNTWYDTNLFDIIMHLLDFQKKFKDRVQVRFVLLDYSFELKRNKIYAKREYFLSGERALDGEYDRYSLKTLFD